MSTAMTGYGNSSSMHVFRSHLTQSAGPCSKALAIMAGALLTTVPHQVNGATISARSPALADVTTAISLAKDGDIVIVPEGTANWASDLIITKGITLQGQTTINGAGTSTATASDKTIIKNDATSKPNMINVTITAAQSFRLTGFTIQANLSKGTQVGLGSSGSTPATNMRVDHCHFVGFTGRGVWTSGWVYGVADHNYMQPSGNGQCFFINTASYGGKLLGHGAWADYPWFGTNKFFFIEDNTMVGNGIVTTSGAIDAENGGRYVVRHNDFTNCRPGWHGTEGANRGCRAVEIYDNSFHWKIIPSVMNRSGVALIHDNKWDGTAASSPNHSQIAVFRVTGATAPDGTYGIADGTSSWDVNDTEGNGTYIAGHAPHVFDSGTAKSGTQSSLNATLTDSSKNWSPNQWAGYSVKQMNTSSPCYGKGSYIVSNTSNTITYAYYSATDRGPTLKFAAGDAYQIHRVLVALDQVGRGKGDLLSGSDNTAINTATNRREWPRQALEPAMSWNNVYTPSNTAYGYGGSTPTEIEGRDYHNLGKGFSADSTPSDVSNTYTATLNGVAYTGTYTYPHPLTSTPLPPTNLTIVP
jgi:hypothetical protein